VSIMANGLVGNGYLIASPPSSDPSRPLGAHDTSTASTTGGRGSHSVVSSSGDLGPLWLQASPHHTRDSDNDLFDLPGSYNHKRYIFIAEFCRLN